MNYSRWCQQTQFSSTAGFSNKMKSRLPPFSLIRIQCRLIVFGFVVFYFWVNPDNIICWQTRHTGLFQIPCLGSCPLWTDRKYYWSVWQNVRFLASLIRRLILFQICTVCQWPCSWASFVCIFFHSEDTLSEEQRGGERRRWILYSCHKTNPADTVVSRTHSCRYCDTLPCTHWYFTTWDRRFCTWSVWRDSRVIFSPPFDIVLATIHIAAFWIFCRWFSWFRSLRKQCSKLLKQKLVLDVTCKPVV